MLTADFLVSIIVPVYNEEKNIIPFLKKILPIISNYHYEILFVNDGSKDLTNEIIKKEIKKNKKIKLISFSRNFGHQKALSCGYQFVKGEAVISLDVDLQDPPEIIPQMIKKWQRGATIVYAKRKRRKGDSLCKRFTADFFYKLINFLSDIPIPYQVGDFRLLDRKAVDFINNLKEESRFLRGLVSWSGYSSDYVLFERDKRFAGETHYPFSKMLNFALEGITSFSTKPLRIASYFGFLSASLGFSGVIYALYRRIFLPHQYWVTGWTTLSVAVMFFGGIQLITIGIIGEYIGKIYQEVQQRPRFVIKEKVNL